MMVFLVEHYKKIGNSIETAWLIAQSLEYLHT